MSCDIYYITSRFYIFCLSHPPPSCQIPKTPKGKRYAGRDARSFTFVKAVGRRYPILWTARSSLLRLGRLPLRPHRLPPHEIAREREQHGIDRDPDEEHAEIEPDPRVQIEQRAPRRFDDVMQRPRVAPVVPFGRQVQGVEGSRHVGDDPEDQPHGRPRLPDGHGDVLASETEGDHADEVDHPVDDECAFAVRIGVVGDRCARSSGAVEGDLEGKRDERVGQGHEEVSEHRAHPADDDEFPELDGRVPSWCDESGVDGQEEGKTEEGDDDEVDETDCDGWCGDRGVEGAETEH